ncbi:MAG: type 1 glutamine amidotransferase domain-containing protein [Solirubrobacterales bacterium]
MSDQLQGKRIAFLVANEGVEQVELTEPLLALGRAGAQVDLLAPEDRRIEAFNQLERGDSFSPTATVAKADAGDYDGLVIPGGVANSDRLRTEEDAVEFTHAYFETGNPIGVICHGPWILIEAGVVSGRTLTSWPSLQTDLRNAGARWVDEEVRVDRRLISSRKPADLEAFSAMIVKEFAAAGASTGGRKNLQEVR